MNPIGWIKKLLLHHAGPSATGHGWFSPGPATLDDAQALQTFRSWVFAAVHLNASAVAACPLRHYAWDPDGRLLYRATPPRRRRLRAPGPHFAAKTAEWGRNWVQLTQPHPLLQLLHRPGPFGNGYELLYTLACHLELTGDAYLYAHPNADQTPGASALYALPPDQVRPLFDDRARTLTGYTLQQPGTQPVTLSPDRVVHIRRPNPAGGFHGLGKAQAAWPAIQLNDAHTRLDLALADNQARPDYAAVIRSGATPAQLERFEAQVQSKLRGPANAGRFLAITGDVQLTPLSFAPKDLSGRKEIIEEIAAVFGVPVSLLRANDPNKASAETGRRAWCQHTVLPLCRLIEEALNAHYLPIFGHETAQHSALAFDNPVPEDRRFELDRRTRLLAAGVLTREEARAEEGL